MSHTHKILDTDVSFVIDAVSRSISTTSDKAILMQYDHNSERYTFQIPRFIEGHDVSLSDRVDIHYNNLSSNGKDENQNVYNVDDLVVDGDNVYFTWLVSRNATTYAGSLNFIVSISCFDDEGNVVYSWHTDIYKNIRISAGYDYSKNTIEEYSDILQQWYHRLFGTTSSATTDIEAAKSTALSDIESAKTTVISDIESAKTVAITDVEDKVSRLVESIPEDYSEFKNELVDIRVGADGTTYSSAGKAVREQVGDINDAIFDMITGSNILDPNGEYAQNKQLQCWDPGTTTIDGLYDVEGDYTSPVMTVQDGVEAYCFLTADGTIIGVHTCGLYDKDGISLEYTSDGIVYIPENCKYMRFSHNSDIASVQPYEDGKSYGYELAYYGTKKNSKIPSKTSELENDAGYITVNEIPEDPEPTRLLKPTVVLIFDQSSYDNRAELLNNYGFKGTFSFMCQSDGSILDSDISAIKSIVADGHDVAAYAGPGDKPAYRGDTSSDEWYSYIKAAVTAFNNIGYYLPTQYACAEHKASQAVVDACEALGFKYVSCGYKLVSGDSWDTDPDCEFYQTSTNTPFSLAIAPYGLPGKTWDEIKAEIDSAVDNCYLILPFTHLVSESPSSIDTSVEIYTQMLEYIKALSDAGTVDVLTMRELYNKYHSADGKERDYTRLMSAIVG